MLSYNLLRDETHHGSLININTFTSSTVTFFRGGPLSRDVHLHLWTRGPHRNGVRDTLTLGRDPDINTFSPNPLLEIPGKVDPVKYVLKGTKVMTFKTQVFRNEGYLSKGKTNKIIEGRP